MNLAIITPTIRSGDGQGGVNYHLAHEALRRNHRVTLVAARIAEDLRVHPGVTCAPLNWSRMPTDLVKFQLFAAQSARWLRKCRTGVDMVHANGFVTWEPADVNTSHFVHGGWLRSSYRTADVRLGVKRAYHRVLTALDARLEKRAYHRAKRVVAVSQRVKQQLIEIGTPADKIDVVLNGVDLNCFHPGPASRKALGLPEDKTVGLFVGDLGRPLKNLETVLRALRLLPNAHLAVAGVADGTPYPAMASRLGLDGRVHFLGFRKDIANVMRAADLFVFPSRSESCPLVLFEALASGLPAILARTVGAAEIVGDDCGAVLDDPNDFEGLAEYWQRFTADERTHADMRCAARSAAEPYSWARMADAYFGIYERLL
jgi:glycosyltransferase involved in cell wall biosynthesis